MAAEINVKLGLAAFAVVAGLFAQATHATTFTWQGDGANATGPGVPTPDATEVLAEARLHRSADDRWQRLSAAAIELQILA